MITTKFLNYGIIYETQHLKFLYYYVDRDVRKVISEIIRRETISSIFKRRFQITKSGIEIEIKLYKEF